MTRKKKNNENLEKEDKKISDPEESMEGPISSLVQAVKKEVEKDNNETKEEADKKREANM